MGVQSSVPCATFAVTRGRDHDQYYIRFNPLAAKALRHLRTVELQKTADNRYIILKPVTVDHPMPWMNSIKFVRSGAYIYTTARVKERFLKPEWFDKRRCKIKKDRHGNIYICMNERVDETDE